MMTARIRTGAIAALMLAGLAACGNKTSEGTSFTDALRQVATENLPVPGREEATASPAPAKSPAEKAAEALRVNPSPLIMVILENEGRSQVMAMTGENAGKRTYMTPNEQALIMRRGMLIGTRGLGNDLSVAEPQTESLIRAGASGQGQRIMRYYTGDGLETPLRFDCTTGPSPKPGVLAENCSGHGITFQNTYITQGGRIIASRQWGGPKLGYMSIQSLRY